MALTGGPEATLDGLRGEAEWRRGQRPRAPTLAGEWQEDGQVSWVGSLCKLARGSSSPGQKQSYANTHAMVRAVWAGPFPGPESLWQGQRAQLKAAAVVCTTQ